MAPSCATQRTVAQALPEARRDFAAVRSSIDRVSIALDQLGRSLIQQLFGLAAARRSVILQSEMSRTFDALTTPWYTPTGLCGSWRIRLAA